jgi:hypothetical protein
MKKQEEGKILKIDEQGNEIYIQQDIIYLKFKNEGRARRIAHIRKEHNELFMMRVYDKHRHRKSNSYGFNYAVLKNARVVKYVSLRDDFNLYRIPIGFILEQGKHLFFKQKGFELQLFVSIDLLHEFIVV